jgi:hypothetical protein
MPEASNEIIGRCWPDQDRDVAKVEELVREHISKAGAILKAIENRPGEL